MTFSDFVPSSHPEISLSLIRLLGLNLNFSPAFVVLILSFHFYYKTQFVKRGNGHPSNSLFFLLNYFLSGYPVFCISCFLSSQGCSKPEDWRVANRCAKQLMFDAFIHSCTSQHFYYTPCKISTTSFFAYLCMAKCTRQISVPNEVEFNILVRASIEHLIEFRFGYQWSKCGERRGT